MPSTKSPTLDDVRKRLAHWSRCGCGHIAQMHNKQGQCEDFKGSFKCPCTLYNGTMVWNVATTAVPREICLFPPPPQPPSQPQQPNLHYFEIQHYVRRIGWVTAEANRYSSQEIAEQQLLHFLMEHPKERTADYRVRPVIHSSKEVFHE